MSCTCCTPTVDNKPASEPERVATEGAECGCGRGGGCRCGTHSSADTERHPEEIRRVSELEPTEA